jgi:hypothetical protein
MPRVKITEIDHPDPVGKGLAELISLKNRRHRGPASNRRVRTCERKRNLPLLPVTSAMPWRCCVASHRNR